jgi:xylan 1,4-beta-xylosidase
MMSLPLKYHRNGIISDTCVNSAAAFLSTSGEQIASPLRDKIQLDLTGNPNNCGVWAPDLSYYNGIFYLAYTDVKTQKRPFYNCHNYLVWTGDITKNWSEPVYLNSTGFDPSIFHDTDGKSYLVNMRNGFKGILLQEYDKNSRSLTGPVSCIFRGTDAGYTEGPHIYRRKDWYYLITAEGGTGYNHQVTVARSADIRGPYEASPLPLLSSKDHPELVLQKAGHADLVETPGGDTYIVYLCSRPLSDIRRCPLGRETAVQKIVWTHDGWPVTEKRDGLPVMDVIVPCSEPACVRNYSELELDHFDEKELPVWYSFLREYPAAALSLSERSGFLRLYGQESITSVHHVTLIARPQRFFNFCAETSMDFTPECPEQVAGLCYIYNNENFYLLYLSADDCGNRYISFLKIINGIYDPEHSAGKIMVSEQSIFFRLCVEQKEGCFYYSADGRNWNTAFYPFDASLLSDEACKGFTGAHIALYCHDMTGRRKYADFDWLTIKENIRNVL